MNKDDKKFSSSLKKINCKINEYIADNHLEEKCLRQLLNTEQKSYFFSKGLTLTFCSTAIILLLILTLQQHKSTENIALNRDGSLYADTDFSALIQESEAEINSTYQDISINDYLSTQLSLDNSNLSTTYNEDVYYEN